MAHDFSPTLADFSRAAKHVSVVAKPGHPPVLSSPCRDLVVGRSSELYELLGSGSSAQVEGALDEVAEMYAGDFNLDDDQA
jgi:hypothetical protein